MVYTLASNAVSSLSIAIDHFKKFFYHSEDYTESEINEAIKICIVFLENSIELLLKAILVKDDHLSIYADTNNRKIRRALTQVDESHRLEDILIGQGNFQTLKYSEIVTKYNQKYHNSAKVDSVLSKLGIIRNAITHFGINYLGSRDKIIIELLNTFDIIYNYLYPQLITIESISDIFTSDGFVVDTIHGPKPLFDESFAYNNIVDFLDELLCDVAESFTLNCRLSDPSNSIHEYLDLLKIAMADHKFTSMLIRNHAELVFRTCDFAANDFYFDILKDGQPLDTVFTCYSRFHHATFFCNEVGAIFFLVVHDSHEIYLYGNRSASFYPNPYEPEPDMLWLDDLNNGLCKKLNLSKRNIIAVFDTITKTTNE